jgi:uncharacterized protein (DUF362 family)
MSKGISRRDFLKRTYGLGVAVGLSSLLPGLKSFGAETEPPPDLGVATGDTGKAVRRAVELVGGISAFVRTGDRVLIKPNMSFGNPPNWGSTTDPKVMKALCDLCLGAGAKKIIIMDHTLRAPEACLAQTGIKDAVADLSEVTVVTANTERLFAEVPVPNGEFLKSVLLAKELGKTDCLINVPCAKTHAATGVSFGMKNLMGLIWDRQFFHEKIDLNRGIAELATLIRPKLIIMDATRALVTGGPGGPGKVEELGTIVAGTDQVAVDSFATTLAPWYGQTWTGRQVKHILEAFKLGLGTIDIEKLKIERVAV